MDRRDVTVVCCYNNLEQYRCFEKSLRGQNIEYELIGIDNCKGKFLSCAAALNSATQQIKTKYVIYAHQDIELPEPDMLEQFYCYLEQIGAEDILGVAGAVEDLSKSAREKTCVLSKVRHGKDRQTAGEREYFGIVACESVDECFFGGYTEFFRTHPFDEVLCDNWHLYGVERCLYTRARGNAVYVCDIPLIHNSTGTISKAYNEGFYRVAGRYAKENKTEGTQKLDWMRTVCGSSPTDFIHRVLFYLKRELLIRMNRY